MVSLDKLALALSDPIRLQILDVLAAGRDGACCSPANPDDPVAVCSCDLLAVLGLAQSRLSYHMKELRESGLVTEQKRGRWIYFSLNRAALTEFTQAVHQRFSCCSVPLIQLDTDESRL